jgi:hypothetical protein
MGGGTHFDRWLYAAGAHIGCHARQRVGQTEKVITGSYTGFEENNCDLPEADLSILGAPSIGLPPVCRPSAWHLTSRWKLAEIPSTCGNLAF